MRCLKPHVEIFRKIKFYDMLKMGKIASRRGSKDRDSGPRPPPLPHLGGDRSRDYISHNSRLQNQSFLGSILNYFRIAYTHETLLFQLFAPVRIRSRLPHAEIRNSLDFMTVWKWAFWSQKMYLLSFWFWLFLILTRFSSPGTSTSSNWASFAKFGMVIPYKVPRLCSQGFFEFSFF